MTDAISAQEFIEGAGADGWRVAGAAASAVFQTGSFVAGVGFIEAIAELAEAANHHPDVDLRFPTVTVRLSSHDIGGLSRRDLELARRISAAALELDIRPEAPETSEGAE